MGAAVDDFADEFVATDDFLKTVPEEKKKVKKALEISRVIKKSSNFWGRKALEILPRGQKKLWKN